MSVGIKFRQFRVKVCNRVIKCLFNLTLANVEDPTRIRAEVSVYIQNLFSFNWHGLTLRGEPIRPKSISTWLPVPNLSVIKTSFNLERFVSNKRGVWFVNTDALQTLNFAICSLSKNYCNSYQAPRPWPRTRKYPCCTKFLKCCLRVLRFEPVSLMESAIVTRPCSRANSTIFSERSGNVARTIFSRSTFFSSRRTCSASERRKNISQGCQFGATLRIVPCVWRRAR